MGVGRAVVGSVTGWFLVVVLVVSFPAWSAAAQQTTLATMGQLDQTVIAELNAWRLSQNLAPLKINQTLNNLAAYQADFLVTQRTLDASTIHTGRNGEQPPVRAQYDTFNWPNYGTPQRIAIGEIAAVGTVESALGFWRSSPVHRQTVTNPTYREVGIATRQRNNGTLFIVVFGARPNILPALVSPDGLSLYLTDEQFVWAVENTWIKRPAEYFLFDAAGRPLTTGWQPWRPRIDLPTNAGGRLFILNRAGDVQTMSEVNIGTDVVLLPGALVTAEASATATLALPTSTATTPGFVFATSTPQPSPTVAPTLTLTPSPTATPQPGTIEIVYGPRSLTIINTGTQPVDISTLVLDGATYDLPIQNWGRTITGLPLNRFPGGHCLQVWAWSEPSGLAQPANCVMRRSIINVAPEQRFWAADNFTVMQQGTTIQTCALAASPCEFQLPAVP